MMSDSLEHTVNISDRVAIDDCLLNYTKLAGQVKHIFVSCLCLFLTHELVCHILTCRTLNHIFILSLQAKEQQYSYSVL